MVRSPDLGLVSKDQETETMCVRLPSLWDVPVSFPNDASDAIFDPLMARENPFDAAQSGFPLTGPKREFLTAPAHDQVTSAPNVEKKKEETGFRSRRARDEEEDRKGRHVLGFGRYN